MPGQDPPPPSPDSPKRGLRSEDVVSQLTEHYGPTLFLGLHTAKDTLERLAAKGIPQRLAQLGFRAPRLEISAGTPILPTRANSKP